VVAEVRVRVRAPSQHLVLIAVQLDRPIVVGNGGAHALFVIARLPARSSAPEVKRGIVRRELDRPRVVGDRIVPAHEELVVDRALEPDHWITQRELDRARQVAFGEVSLAFDLRAQQAEPRAGRRRLGRKRTGTLLVIPASSFRSSERSTVAR
jgi:hypothetical protein